MSFRLFAAVVSCCCLMACGAKKTATPDDAAAGDVNADAGLDIASDATPVDDAAADGSDQGTDAQDGDTDQTITDATLPDIPANCQKTCKIAATGMNKACGPDGCGSVCGFCSSGQICAPDQTKCIAPCTKQCTTLAGKTKMCGDDGCGYGGQCGVCDAGFNCGIDFLCHPNDCKPDCTGKVCGDDGCGKDCGLCASIEYCSDAGLCVKSACAGIDLVKGTCDGDVLLTCQGTDALAKKIALDCTTVLPADTKTCGFDIPSQKNACVQKVCKPSCKLPDGTVKKCGDDGCGGSCGSCPTGWGCPAGVCEPQVGAACGGVITTIGKCVANAWVYCQNSKVAIMDCTALSETCVQSGAGAGCQ